MVEYKIIADATQMEFEQAYALYKESFPAGELESKADIKAMLGETGLPEKNPTSFWIVAMQDLQVSGLVTMQYLAPIGAAFLGYLVVKTEYRKQGVGSALAITAFKTIRDIHFKLSAKPFLGVFCEIDFLKGKSSIRRKRLDFWGRLGMCPLEVAWRYPQLTPGARASGMYLAFWPTSKEFIAFSRQEMMDIVGTIYKTIYGGRRSDVEFDLVCKSIACGSRSVTFRTVKGCCHGQW